MTNPRLLAAAALSALALALAIFGIAGSTSTAGMSGHLSLAPSHFGSLSSSHVPGLIALGASVAAFALSWGQRSFLIAGLLSAAGVLYSVHLSSFMGDHGALSIMGPLAGVIFAHAMLALGIAKGMWSVRSPAAKAAA